MVNVPGFSIWNSERIEKCIRLLQWRFFISPFFSLFLKSQLVTSVNINYFFQLVGIGIISTRDFFSFLSVVAAGRWGLKRIVSNKCRFIGFNQFSLRLVFQTYYFKSIADLYNKYKNTTNERTHTRRKKYIDHSLCLYIVRIFLEFKRQINTLHFTLFQFYQKLGVNRVWK
jgi:hypothetical protein